MVTRIWGDLNTIKEKTGLLVTYHSNAPSTDYPCEHIYRYADLAHFEQAPIEGQQRTLNTANNARVADFRDEEASCPGCSRVWLRYPDVLSKTMVEH